MNLLFCHEAYFFVMFIMACTYLVCDLWCGGGNESVCNGGCGKTLRTTGQDAQTQVFWKWFASPLFGRASTSDVFTQAEPTRSLRSPIKRACSFTSFTNCWFTMRQNLKQSWDMFPGEVTIARRTQLRSKCTSAKPIVHLIYTNVQ